jgi:hypothetical protein
MWDQFQDRGAYQPVKNHDIGLLEQSERFHSQQIRVSGTRSHQ